jgi:cytochrome oxidase Cu insertion factor (SCO1/SenC/PrrC family)
MSIRRKVCRPTWLSLACLALLVGLALGTAMGETPEPPTGLAAVKPAVPMAAFSLPGLRGSGFDSAVLKDKVVVVRFWATW